MSSVDSTCPYIGLKTDSSVRLSYSSESHRCYALLEVSGFAPDIDFQTQYCLTAAHIDCPRFRARVTRAPELDAQPMSGLQPRRPAPVIRLVLAGLTAILLLVAGWQLVRLLQPPAAPVASSLAEVGSTPSASVLWPTPPPSAELSPAESTPAQATPQPEMIVQTVSTPAPDEVQLVLTPMAGAVGWVGSSEARGNHFGDSFLHAGIYEDEIIHSAIQFDLTRVPRGAPIRYAALELTGLDDRRLNPNADAIWEVRWLASEINEDWSRLSFQDIHNARVLQSLIPAIAQDQLAPLVTQRLELNQEQRTLLERAVVDQQTLLAFRIDGPQAGADNLFTWDSGYGPATLENGPKLVIVAGPPPATPPAVPTQSYIVVTSTPTPANVLTAAAFVQTATAYATLVGTVAPTPRSMVTATPTPANAETAQAERLQAGLPPVVAPTPLPVNATTQTAIALFATAQALTTGTWTPIPPDAVTATPTATFVVVTNTPTPANAATLLAQVVAEVTRTATAGPPTPWPPAVVTATPTPPATTVPANEATVEARAALATIAALTIGTYTPTPLGELAPTATPSPLPTMASASAIPPRLRNKIVFRSDRLGSPRLFVVDADCLDQAEGCRQVEPLPVDDLAGYLAAVSRLGLSPDEQERFLAQIDLFGRPQTYVQTVTNGALRQLVEVWGASFDAAWAPDGTTIALVTDAPGNDEIFVVGRDGANLRRLTFTTWEQDRHPAWSPDGSRILFDSNRTDGRRQLWIMNADGSGLRNVSNSEYNDWDPVWIK